jgi:hypothetical protein
MNDVENSPLLGGPPKTLWYNDNACSLASGGMIRTWCLPLTRGYVPSRSSIGNNSAEFSFEKGIPQLHKPSVFLKNSGVYTASFLPQRKGVASIISSRQSLGTMQTSKGTSYIPKTAGSEPAPSNDEVGDGDNALFLLSLLPRIFTFIPFDLSPPTISLKPKKTQFTIDPHQQLPLTMEAKKTCIQ